MFAAGNGSGYGANDGLGGVYDDERSRREGASAHALGCTDAFRCGVFVGPAMMLCGIVMLVRTRDAPAHGTHHAGWRRGFTVCVAARGRAELQHTRRPTRALARAVLTRVRCTPR